MPIAAAADAMRALRRAAFHDARYATRLMMPRHKDYQTIARRRYADDATLPIRHDAALERRQRAPALRMPMPPRALTRCRRMTLDYALMLMPLLMPAL